MAVTARAKVNPCPGCARTVAYRYAVQRQNGGGKARVPHKCSHGTACVFGVLAGIMGRNWPTCPECLKERRAEYAARTQAA